LWGTNWWGFCWPAKP